MGIRISKVAVNLNELEKLKSKNVEIQLILNNGNTLTGKINRISNKTLHLRDNGSFWYNRKAHTHEIPFSTILEINLDTMTSW